LRRRARRSAWCAAGLGLALSPAAVAKVIPPPIAPAPAPPAAAADVADGPRYVRTAEEGSVVALETSIRRLNAPGDGPDVTLVGVVHIGDPSYYKAIERALADHEIVLFESVKPAGAGGAGGADDDERVASTRSALDFVARLLELHQSREGGYPVSFTALRRFAEGKSLRLASFLDDAYADAWGRAFVYERAVAAADGAASAGYRLRSLGADGAAGGEGVDADIAAPPAGVLPPLELSSGGAIQSELAAALKLSFQLDAIDYDQAGWQCSDMSIDQVERSLARRGSQTALVAGLLDESGVTAQLGRMMLGLLKAADAFMESALSDAMKVMLIETLGDETILHASLGQLDDALKDVIIDERNGVVVNDVIALADAPKPPPSIAILYGAGHLPDLEARLAERMGYSPVETTWCRAIEVDLAQSAMDEQQLAMLRRMMRGAVRQAMPGNAR
jgi:general secretion pathway protein G